MQGTENPVGLTKDAGYQIGVRRTLKVHYADAWRILTSPEGANLWLGESPDLKLLKGEKFTLKDGSQVEVRACARESHVRLAVLPQGWEKPTIIQLRVMPQQDRAVIAFHQEHLRTSDEREDRRQFYMSVLDTLEAQFRTA